MTRKPNESLVFKSMVYDINLADSHPATWCFTWGMGSVLDKVP